MVGTRGVPARYGGFETAVEEIGRRLVDRGHRVQVHRRAVPDEVDRPQDHLGMELVTLPAVRSRSLETLTHTAASTARLLRRDDVDVVFLFNAANSPFLPLLHLRRLPVAVHVDGLEWRRAKWSGAGRRYYRAVEGLAVRWADALIADAPGIASYYDGEFGASTELLAYGAPVLDVVGSGRLGALGLTPGDFHLVVARFEPENHVEEIVAGFRASTASLPLVVVGSAPYNDDYTESVRAAAGDDPRIRLLGGVWDQALLDELYGNARLYLHGHSVGGTNPSLLRAMGAGTAVAAWDVDYNRDVLGDDAPTFDRPGGVAVVAETMEARADRADELGAHLRRRAAQHYRWDEVSEGYEELALRLAEGWTRRGEVDGRRRTTTAAAA